MALIARSTRDGIVREIMGGVEAQVRAQGGDFARAAPGLDDAAWVGRQMVQVYGVAPLYQGLLIALVALLAVASVPGMLVQPADGMAAIGLSLFGFAALVALLFRGATALSPKAALTGAAVAAAVRFAILFVPQGGYSLAETSDARELALFAAATLLLFVVAAVPLLAARKAASDEED
jgi:hypothetical protein